MEGAIYYEAIATVIFSHVIEYNMLFSHVKLTWYFICVYIIR